MKQLLFIAFVFIQLFGNAQAPTNGMIAYFPFNGNAVNSGSASITATLNSISNTANNFGVANSAIQFAGNVNSYVSFTDNGNLDFSGSNNFTICLAFLTGGGSNMGLFDNCINYGGAGIWFWNISGDIYNIQANYKNGSVGSPAATNFPLNQWNHVVFQRNNGTLSVYINGVFRLSSTEGSMTPSYPFPPVNGALSWAGFSPPRYLAFNGKMDELRIYNRALSAAEITAVYDDYATGGVQPVTITCPSNVTVPNDPGQCGANVSYPSATATGAPPPSITYSKASGSFFSVGTTTVTATATDGTGSTTTCSFTITVTGGTDTDADGISDVCDPDDDGDTVPDESDCAPLDNTKWQQSLLYVDNDNDGYTNGQQTICYGAVIPAGYKASSLGSDCNDNNIAVWTSALLYIDNDADGYSNGQQTVCYGANIPNGFSLASSGNDCNDNNGEVHPGATDICNNIDDDCDGSIDEDFINTVVTCPFNGTVTKNLQSGCTYTISGNEFNATVSQNCGPLGYTLTGATTGSGSSLANVQLNTGTTTVTWSATNADEQVTSCSFNVYVVPALPSLTCPVNITVAATNGQCGAVVNYVAPTLPGLCTNNDVLPPTTVTFNYTGSIQNWTVPQGVTSIIIDAKGARGGVAMNGVIGGKPGYGGRVQTTLNVTPGQVLHIYIGGHGTDANGSLSSPLAGGYNGGGYGTGFGATNTGGGGGGASDIRSGGTNLSNRIVIAAGGGGVGSDGSNTNGGGGGGLIGQTAANGNNSNTVEATGGTQVVGGTGGSLGSYAPGQNGQLGLGGNGGGGLGGGGGAGYYGGGGGVWAGGGGGSSFADATLTSNTIHTSDYNNGDGLISITYGSSQAGVSQTGGLPSGSNFPVGTTTNTFMLTDAFGQTSNCSFTVTVNDEQAPTVAQPNDITVANAVNQCSASVNFSASATDNCSVTSLRYYLNYNTPGQEEISFPKTFAVGSHVVTVVAKDAANNTTTKTFTITVTDSQAPSITCPAPVTINTSQGSCTGTTTLVPPTVTDNCNSFGNALSFNGGYVNVPNVAVLNPFNEWTLETWVKRTRSGVQESLIEKYVEPASNYGYLLRILSTNKAQAGFVFGSFAGYFISGTTNILPDTWYHLAATFNRTTGVMKLYVNGVLDAQVTGMTGLPTIPNTASLKLGARGDDAGTRLSNGGIMDEIRIWNVERTQAQIQLSMNSELGAQAGLIALYHLNQGIAGGNNTGLTTVTDGSGNSNNGSLISFALTGSTSNWVNGQGFGSTLTNNAPATYLIGNTNVTWTATDGSGNSASCIQVVTVVDNQAPTFTCPGNQNINLSNTCRLIVPDLINGLTGSDNCGTVTFTQSPVAGVSLNSSHNQTHNVVITANDGNGNISTCTVVLTGKDIAPPVINCVENITRNNDPGVCGAIINYTAPAASDNCGCAAPTSIAGYTLLGTYNGHKYFLSNLGATWTNAKGIAAGLGGHLATVNSSGEQLFLQGATNVPAWIGFTDEANEGTFIWITGEPVTFTNWLTPGEPNNYGGNENYAVLNGHGTFWNDLSNSWDGQFIVEFECETNTGGVIVTQTQGLPSGSTFPIGITTNTFLATDAGGNTSSCSFTVTVTDNEKPTVTRGSIGSCYSSVASAEAAALEATTYNDNCSSFEELEVNVSTAGTCAAVITVTVTDAANNSRSVTYNTRIDDTAPVLSVTPGNVIVNCQSVPPVPPVTASDNCDGSVNVSFTFSSTKGNDPAQGNYYNYAITRKWSASDACGNTVEHVQIITVQDVTAPNLTCPDNKVVSNEAGLCSAQVTFSAGSTDNCSVPSVNYYLYYGTADQQEISSPWTFAVGSYTVKVISTDPSGNSNNCTFTVTVNDTEKPTVTKGSIESCYKTTAAAEAAALTATTYSDNCTPNAQLNVQATTVGTCSAEVTITVTDAVNNSRSVTYNTRIDNASPVLNLTPANVTVNCHEVPSVPAVTANDNCDGPVIVGFTSSSTKGSDPVQSNFYNYSITRKWLASDACGNTVEHIQIITVQDITAPAITCPADKLSIPFDFGQLYATIAIGSATATDNCAGTSNITIAGTRSDNVAVSNQQYPLGTTTVAWSATDPSTNSSGCTQTITVRKRNTKVVYTGEMTDNKINVQYSDIINLQAKLTDDEGLPTANNISGRTITFQLLSGTTVLRSKTATSNANGIAADTFKVEQAPGMYIVKTIFAGDSYFNSSYDEDNCEVKQEDAMVEYNGSQYFTTASATTMNGSVTLAASLNDIDDGSDKRGDIRKSKATFRDGGPAGNVLGSANLPVGLISPGVLTNGLSATSQNYSLNSNEAGSGGKIFQVWVGASDHYKGADAGPTPVTLALPGQDFVTGGGHVVLNNSAGTYAGTANSKMNFGFTMKWNKSGKNLQGQINIVFRKWQLYNNEWQWRVYQMKSNAINSMAVVEVGSNGQPASATNPAVFRKAIINTKANLKDVTDPLNNIDLGGNHNLVLEALDHITANGGTSDKLSVMLMAATTNDLLFSSNWTANATIAQTINGGNINVRNGSTGGSAPKSSTNQQLEMEKPTIKAKDEFSVKAYPNPSTHQFTINVSSNSNEALQIQLFDATGRQIETINARTNESMHFGEKLRAGIYFAKVTLGNKTETIKLIKQ